MDKKKLERIESLAIRKAQKEISRKIWEEWWNEEHKEILKRNQIIMNKRDTPKEKLSRVIVDHTLGGDGKTIDMSAPGEVQDFIGKLESLMAREVKKAEERGRRQGIYEVESYIETSWKNIYKADEFQEGLSRIKEGDNE